MARRIRARAVVRQVGEPPPAERSANLRSAAVLWAKIAVSVVLLGYQLRAGGLDAVGRALLAADPAWVFGAVALYLTSHVVNAQRWNWYAREFGFIGRASEFMRLYFAALFVNLFAPGTIAGDVTRGLALGGSQRRAAALGSVLAHRLSGMVALFAIAGSAALVQREYPLTAAARLAAWVVPLGGVAALLAAPSAVGRIAARVGRPVALPRAWAAATGRTLVIAAIYHALQISSAIFLARAIGIESKASTLALFVPLVNAAGMIPVTVSGVGIREAGYVLLLHQVGIPREQALALGLLGSALVFAAGLAGAPAFFKGRPASPDYS